MCLVFIDTLARTLSYFKGWNTYPWLRLVQIGFKDNLLDQHLLAAYTKEHLTAALIDLFDIMYKGGDIKEYMLMLDQLSVYELRNELPVEEHEMKEFMEPYLSKAQLMARSYIHCLGEHPNRYHHQDHDIYRHPQQSTEGRRQYGQC